MRLVQTPRLPEIGAIWQVQDKIGLCLLLALAALVSGTLAAENSSGGQAVTWIESYDEAVEVARATGKPIFLEFRCAP